MLAAGQTARRVGADEIELRLEPIAGRVDLDGVERGACVDFRELGPERPGILQRGAKVAGRDRHFGLVDGSQLDVPQRRIRTIDDEPFQLMVGARARLHGLEELALAALDLGGRLRDVRFRRDLRIDARLHIVALGHGEGHAGTPDLHVARRGDERPVGALDRRRRFGNRAAQQRVGAIARHLRDADGDPRRIEVAVLQERLTDFDAERCRPGRRDERQEGVARVAPHAGEERDGRTGGEELRPARASRETARGRREIARLSTREHGGRGNRLIPIPEVAADDRVVGAVRPLDALLRLRDGFALDGQRGIARKGARNRIGERQILLGERRSGARKHQEHQPPRRETGLCERDDRGVLACTPGGARWRSPDRGEWSTHGHRNLPCGGWLAAAAGRGWRP